MSDAEHNAEWNALQSANPEWHAVEAAIRIAGPDALAWAIAEAERIANDADELREAVRRIARLSRSPVDWGTMRSETCAS